MSLAHVTHARVTISKVYWDNGRRESIDSMHLDNRAPRPISCGLPRCQWTLQPRRCPTRIWQMCTRGMGTAARHTPAWM